MVMVFMVNIFTVLFLMTLLSVLSVLLEPVHSLLQFLSKISPYNETQG